MIRARLADTLQRCIIVRMRPARRRVPELDERGEDIGELIGTALSAWTTQVGGKLKDRARTLADSADEFDAGGGAPAGRSSPRQSPVPGAQRAGEDVIGAARRTLPVKR